MPTTHSLAGRIALVTGGASGLGRASAEAAEDGHDTCRDLTPSFMSWPAQLQIPSKRLPTTRV